MAWMFQERLLSPALSSIGNGGEGACARARFEGWLIAGCSECAKSLDELGIEVFRFWNHQWRKNRAGVLLEIWGALHRRTGCVGVVRKVENHRFVPPNPAKIIRLKKGSL